MTAVTGQTARGSPEGGILDGSAGGGALKGRSGTVAVAVLAVAAVCALLLALPGQTVATKYVEDLFMVLDGAYRVAAGQVPSRDFHTVLGPVAHLVPAAGYRLTGSLGAALPTGTALLILALAPAMAHVFATRLRPVVALPFAAFLLLILAAPVNLGEPVTALSFTRFYNRIGWAALATLLVMYLPPEHPRARQDRVDALCAGLLALVMLYTKISYGVAALGFLAFLVLVDPRQRRWAALALALILAAGLAVEAFWRSTAAHLADLRLAWAVDGGLRGTWGQIADHALGNLADFVLLGLFAGLALWRRASLRDALFYGFCAAAGFLIINQNFQAWGIITLHAAAAVAAERILRLADRRPESEHGSWSVSAGTKLLFLAYVLPTVIHGAVALCLHFGAAVARAGDEVALPNLGRLRLAQLWTWSEYEGASAYLATVRDGARVLAGLEPKPRAVLVLDLANPFTAGLGLEPPRGDAAGLRWGRTMNATHFLAPEPMLAGVEIVLEPRLAPAADPADPATVAREGLRALYGPFLAAAFEVVRETPDWRVHRRRAPRAQASCGAACGPTPDSPAAVGAP